MATSNYYFKGTAKWCKKDKPDEKYNHYSIDLYPDEASLELFEQSGCQLTVRDDKETGEKYIQFRRPHQKQIKDDLVTFGPPVVLNAQDEPIDVLIGNGSTVTCKVAVYDSMKGKGSRLEAIRVEELVEYEGNKVEEIGIDTPF